MARIHPSAERLNELTRRIIAAAIAVHRALGPGLLEGAYLACISYELKEAGLSVEVEKPLPLIYKGVRLDCAYKVDIVVEGCVIVEIKAQESLAAIHTRQVVTYLKLHDSRVGLLLNFGVRSMREGIKRVVNDFPTDAERSELAREELQRKERK